MSEEENISDGNLDFDEHHHFTKGNSQRFGLGKEKDNHRGPKKGSSNARIKRLVTYLRKHLDDLVKDNPDLQQFHEKHGEKTVASLLMHRVVEEALKDPVKAHPLVRDILNRIDGMMTPEIPIDPDTPVTVIKFVVVDKKTQVEAVEDEHEDKVDS